MSFQSELRGALEYSDARDEVTDECSARLEILDRCLVQWSKRMDLTGFRSREERVRRYFAEAVAVAPFLPPLAGSSGEAIDVGSGGGSPALPLAVVRPDWHWTLVESRRKKCIFLQEAARTLGLASVRVISTRFESLAVDEPVDAITVRGVLVSEALSARMATWLRVGGRLLWLSSRERLEGGGKDLERFSLATVSGPLPLLGGGGASILVLEKRPAETARECFT